MTKDNFHEKITLVLSFLILNNYLLLSLNFSLLLIKINFLIFLVTVLIFYSKNFFENFEKKKFSSKILTFTPETNFEISQMSLSNNFWNLKLHNVKSVGFFYFNCCNIFIP